MVRNFNKENGRIFISGQMHGLSEREWRKNFNDAERELIMHGWHPDNIINPAKLSLIYPNLSRCAYLTIDLSMLRDCSAIYVMSNWERSSGARLEVREARSGGLKVLFEGDL